MIRFAQRATTLHRRVAAIMLLAAALAADASAQTEKAPQKRFFFYHSTRTASGFVEPADNGGYRLTADRSRYLRLSAGSLICIAVVNGHPLNYAYSLAVSIDSSAPSFPDLTKQVKLLQSLFPPPAPPGAAGAAPVPGKAPAPPAAGAPPAPPPTPKEVLDLGELVLRLQTDIDSAKSLVTISDSPEGLGEIERPMDAKRGFRYTRDALTRLSDSAGRFNDVKLKETIAEAVKKARDAAKGDKLTLLTVAGLEGFAAGLRSERDQIAGAFARATDVPEACANVGRGTSTLTLTIAKKDTALKEKRGTSKDFAIQIFNDAPYERPLVSLAPVALAVTAPGAPEFEINNGRLVDAGARAHFRAGMIIALNRYSDGPLNLFGTSVGLGLASQGADQILSDVFGTIMWSVGDVIGTRNDILRVGLGVGTSYQADMVTGYQKNDVYPDSAGPIKDRLQKHWKPAFYLTFTIPALNLGSGS
jgi:hypothetical protein